MNATDSMMAIAEMYLSSRIIIIFSSIFFSSLLFGVSPDRTAFTIRHHITLVSPSSRAESTPHHMVNTTLYPRTVMNTKHPSKHSSKKKNIMNHSRIHELGSRRPFTTRARAGLVVRVRTRGRPRSFSISQTGPASRACVVPGRRSSPPRSFRRGVIPMPSRR